MSIKIENLIKITTSGSYLYLTPQEYTELTNKPTHTALKDINWNGPTPELAKDMRIAELEKEAIRLDTDNDKLYDEKGKLIEEIIRLKDEIKAWEKVSREKDELLAWADNNTAEDIHNFKVIRDKQREEIAKLRCEVAEIGKQYVEENEDNFELLMDLKEADDYIEEQKVKITDQFKKLENMHNIIDGLESELADFRTLKNKGIVEDPFWKHFPVPEPIQPDHGTNEILTELLQGGDIEPIETEGKEIKLTLQQLIDTQAEPIEPTPPPEPEVIAEVVAAPETVTEPAEEAKYPAKKKTGRAAIEVFTAEQKEKYRTMIRAGSSHKEVTVAMVADTGMTLGSASQRYYALLKATTASDAVKALDQRTKVIPQNPVTVITGEVNPRKLSKTVCAELAALPNFESIKEFKNACCENSILKDYNIIDLKGQYKIDRNLTW